MCLGGLFVILLAFASIPNRTAWDQIVFIALNIFGQFNIVVGMVATAKLFILLMNRKLRKLGRMFMLYCYEDSIREWPMDCHGSGSGEILGI
jgi:hypothetical protein